MVRHCQNCDADIRDDLLIACPECKSPFSDTPRQIRLTPEEHQAIVRELWRRLAAWLFGSFSIWGLMSLLSFIFWVWYSALPQVQTKIVERISAEFQQERIRTIISEVASHEASTILREQVAPALKRVETEAASASLVIGQLQQSVQAQSAAVDVVAKQAGAAAKLAEELSAKTSAVDGKLQEIDAALASARTKIEEMDKISQFTRTVVAAQSDDRTAFDQLEVWGADPSFSLHEQARASYLMLRDSHSPALLNLPPKVPWNAGLDPATIGLDELRRDYDLAPAWVKPSLIRYIWQDRKDIPKKDRLTFLADIVSNDSSLNAVEWAGRYLSEALGVKLKPLAVKPLLEIWNQKKSSPEWNQPQPTATSG